MRYLILLLFFGCHSGIKNIQNEKKIEYFEGEVIYSTITENRKSRTSIEQNKRLMGEESIYLYKNGKYKVMTKGGMPITLIYDGGDTLFTQLNSVPVILWTDVKENNDEILDFKIEEKAEEVNGIMCSLLTIRSKQGSYKYYFNKAYKVNPSLFEKHNLGFWKFCTDKTGCMPIKFISDTIDNYCEITANQIEKKVIAEEAFNVPPYPRTEMKQ